MKNSITKAVLLCFFCHVLTQVQAQQQIISQQLVWADAPIRQAVNTHTATPQWREIQHFKGAVYRNSSPTLPFFFYRFPLGADDARLAVSLANTVSTPLSMQDRQDEATIQNDFVIETYTTQKGNQFFGNVKILPIRKNSFASFEKLEKFDLQINVSPQPRAVLRGDFARQSALREGDIYKIALKNTGIHKLDYNFFKNDLKLNPDQIDPRTVKILGNGGGMLPEKNNAPRLDDVVENAITFVGGEDGKFDPQDFILFYGIGPDKTYYDAANRELYRPKNIYSDRSFYFIKISQGNGVRITNKTNILATNYTTNSFSELVRIEDDKFNLLHYNRTNSSTGSGKLWVGDIFNEAARTRTYSAVVPNVVRTEGGSLRANYATASELDSRFSLQVAGLNFETIVPFSRPNSTEDRYGSMSSLFTTFNPTSDTLQFNVTYFPQSGGEGWLDFIQVNLRRNLMLGNQPLMFRDIRSLNYINTTFQLANASQGWYIWDVTNPQNTLNQEFTLINGNQISFGSPTASNLREFVAFRQEFEFLKPEAQGKIANQNLHAFDNLDFLIVYHKNFETAAKRLANHRKTFNNMNVEAVDASQIYNEFSSGATDLTAIRDMARMLHERSARFKFLLLVGDGTFDARNIIPVGQLQASNFIPAYETDESLYSLDAFPSDDYFGLLSPTEGGNIGFAVGNAGDLDIAVGRFPCKTAEEAENIVNKIIRYDTNPVMLGDWRNRGVFMGDDGDGNIHTNDADAIASKVAQNHPTLNIDKLYIDAYTRQVSAGGARVPDLNTSLYNNQFSGMLTLCYLGHGGAKGLAQERILMKEDLESWSNENNPPLLVTATCSFAPYDNPKEVSAGEAALLNAQGGAIALYATTRAVFASANRVLTELVFDTIFHKSQNQAQTIGEIFMEAKNKSGTGDNGQKFTLLGDPAMRLALPRHQIAVTSINAKATDTIRALQRVTIEGIIKGDNGLILNTFNGKIFPTVFDKPVILRTMGQSSGSYPKDFIVQRNIIFKGSATVQNGRWQFTFVVPRDINYDFGNGKISLYAHNNNSLDATGSFENFVIGGTATNVSDNLPPKVEVFMNDDKFVYGGLTNESPTLFAKISDDNGINVSGISVGHDLTGNLNESRNNIILNNFYEAATDDHTRGTVRYPLSKLAAGEYTMRIKAWDVANNASEGMTRFVVAESGQAALSRVINYPNPFSTKTQFQFDHNLVNQNIQIQVQIYTVAGRLVKTIDETVLASGYRVSNLTWDGRDEFGNELARGVYIYKIKIRALNASASEAESQFEKLVIIK